MKTAPRNSTSALRLSDARWAAYATAGAATALASTSAEGQITVVEVNQTFNAAPGQLVSDTFTLGSPNNAFVLGFSRFAAPYEQSGFAGFLIYAVNGAGFRGFLNGDFRYVSRLQFGANVGTAPAAFAANMPNFFATLASGAGGANSQWLNPGEGFVGFRFDGGNGGVQYGWARIVMNGDPDNSFTLVNYAFGGPGEELFAGQVPEPGSLALLAVGALGLVAWRKRRSSTAQP